MKKTSLFYRYPEVLLAWSIILTGLGLILHDNILVCLFGIYVMRSGCRRLYKLIREALDK